MYIVPLLQIYWLILYFLLAIDNTTSTSVWILSNPKISFNINYRDS